MLFTIIIIIIIEIKIKLKIIMNIILNNSYPLKYILIDNLEIYSYVTYRLIRLQLFIDLYFT